MKAATQALREGKDLSGKDGLFTPLIKPLTEAAMKAEREDHLASDDHPNRKNGNTSKMMKTPADEFELDTGRDRSGTFEPVIVKKHQTQLTDALEQKIMALFGLGNSDQDIRSPIADMSGMSLSNCSDRLNPYQLIGDKRTYYKRYR